MNTRPSLHTWVVVADGERARFLAASDNLKTLAATAVPDMVNDNPATHDQGTERPGRTHESAGGGKTGMRHAMAPRVDWHRFEKAEFAHAVAEIVNAAARDKVFGRLVLVAPPKTLGDLRGALSKAAEGAVVQAIAKDLTKLTNAELADYLAEYRG